MGMFLHSIQRQEIREGELNRRYRSFGGGTLKEALEIVHGYVELVVRKLVGAKYLDYLRTKRLFRSTGVQPLDLC